jgi:hypothetical protein
MSKLKTFSILALIFLFTVSLTLSAQVIKDDFRVNDDTVGGTNYTPDVAILESGEEVIVWRDDRNGEPNIYGQAYDNTGAPVDTNFKVSTNNLDAFELNPAIASFGDSVVVSWEYGYRQWLLSDGSREGITFYLGSGNMYRPDVAVNDSGVFVVWDNYATGRGYDVFVKRFNFNGDSIGPRITINDDITSQTQRNPCLAKDNDGNFVVVWEDYRSGSSYDIYGQLLDPLGNKIDTNFRINHNVGNSTQFVPSCAMDWAGNFVVVWRDTRSGHQDIYGQRFDNTGSEIDTNFMINDDAGGNNQDSPTCAMDSAGNFVVAWSDPRGADVRIYGQLFDTAGIPIDTNFPIGQLPGSGDDYNPQIAMNENNFVVTWHRSSDTYTDVYKRRYLNDGTPVGDEVKVNGLEGTANQSEPSIDMNSFGNTVVTWHDERNPVGVYFQRLDALGNTVGENVRVADGYETDIAVAEDSSFVIVYDISGGDDICFQRFRPNGDSIGAPIVISDTNAHTRYYPSTDIDSDNNTVVAWHDSRLGDEDIYAQMIDSLGYTVGDNFRVNDDAGTFGQFYPDVAMMPSGKFLITWHDRRAGNYDIYGQLYDSVGTPVGSNFRIDSGGASSQLYPDAGYLPDGNFVVTWQDYRVPYGIYAQIIDSMGTLIDTNFRVSDHQAERPSASVAPSGAFLIVWRDYISGEYDIYAQKYNPDYSPDSTNFKVNNETESINTYQGETSVATNGNSIIFAWVDPKWQKGYDIAAKVFSWNQGGIEEARQVGNGLKILEVSSPILSSEEWLTISLDSPAEVDFQLINVAGIVVSSKKLDYTTAGIKKVDFDVSKLPCGPYFLSVEIDKGRAVKKTVVIK